jgi:hypothetical protein
LQGEIWYISQYNPLLIDRDTNTSIAAPPVAVAMATVVFPVWGTIHPEVKPILQYQRVKSQDSRMLAGDPDSGYPVDPQNMPLSNTETAVERARRIAAHEGYVDDQHFNEVMGGAGSNVGSAGRRLFSTVQSNVFSQMYGEGSWIMKHVKGKWCTIEFEVSY